MSDPTIPTTPARTIPDRPLTLPEIEEIVRTLVDIANNQSKFAEELALTLADADAPKGV